MNPLWSDTSGEHDIRLQHPSHIKHQVVVVRRSFWRRKGKSEQEDERAGQEDIQESLELVSSNLLEP